MAKKPTRVETRLARVEKEIRDLKASLTAQGRIPWWQQIDGVFKGDRAFAEIVRLGASIRKADRGGSR